MTEGQWLTLLVDVLGGLRDDDRDRGVKCFYNALPMKRKSKEEEREHGGGEFSMSFFVFVEAMARVADFDPEESLSKNMELKFDDWERKRMNAVVAKS